jgi:hypothetical protein
MLLKKRLKRFGRLALGPRATTPGDQQRVKNLLIIAVSFSVKDAAQYHIMRARIN